MRKPAAVRRDGYITVLMAVILLLASNFAPVSANVGLTSFVASAQANNTIKVQWETASEVDTVSFLLYRSPLAAPQSWGDPIYTTPALGALAGYVYTHVDNDPALQVGVLYYYRLEDVDSSGTITPHGPVSAGIGVATSTPTNTPTVTPRPSNTPSGSEIQPTATQRYTNTPPPPPTAVGGPGTAAPGPRSPVGTPTRLGSAVVTTPTRAGGAVIPPTLPPPTLFAEVTAAPPPVETLPPTATVAVVARITATSGPSPTPIIRADATAAVFEAVPTRPVSGVTPQGRSTGGTLAIAGAALAGAALLGGAVYLILRARK